MAKANKRRKKGVDGWTMYTNTVTPQPDTEIKGISTMDGEKAEKELQAAKYVGIERYVKSSLLYDLTGTFKRDAFGSKKRAFDVSQFHGVNNEMFANAGFIECSGSSLVRGKVSIGALALAEKGGVAPDTVANTVNKIRAMSDRIQSNEKHLNDLLNIVLPPGNTKAVKFLRKLVVGYGNNRYGSQILHRMTDTTGIYQKPVEFSKTVVNVSKATLDRCEVLTKDPLTDKIYIIEKEDDKYRLDLYVSKRIWGLLNDYKKVYFASGTMGQMVRAAFVTGQYITAKWILSGKLDKEEMAFYTMCQAIAKYARDKF